MSLRAQRVALEVSLAPSPRRHLMPFADDRVVPTKTPNFLTMLFTACDLVDVHFALAF